MSCRTQYRTPPGPPAPSIAHVANADRQQQAACQSGTILARFPAWIGSNMGNPSSGMCPATVLGKRSVPFWKSRNRVSTSLSARFPRVRSVQRQTSVTRSSRALKPRLWFQAMWYVTRSTGSALGLPHSWPGQLSDRLLAAQVAARHIAARSRWTKRGRPGNRRPTDEDQVDRRDCKSEGGALGRIRGCGCDDPVCPNNRGNRWLVSLQWLANQGYDHQPRSISEWRPGPHRHARIAWPA